MSDVQVQFKRGNTATLNNTPITDGMIYFNTENNSIYMDNGDTRLEYKNEISNFANKAILDTLVLKNDNIIKNPQNMDRIIGNSYIGDNTIIDTVDGLHQSKAWFKVVWEQKENPQPFDTKTIITNGIFPYYFIFDGYVDSENKWYYPVGTYYHYWYTSPITHEMMFDHYDMSHDVSSQTPASHYIVSNDATIFTQFGGSVMNNCAIERVRKIQVVSDIINNTTTFYFDKYGEYYNDIYVESSYYQSEQGNNIPYQIIGVSI